MGEVPGPADSYEIKISDMRVLRRYVPIIARMLLVASILAPNAAFAAPSSFGALADLLVTILNSATATAVVLVFALYFFGVARDLRKIGEGEAGKRKEFFVWGIIALFVMISVGGIVALLENTLFGSSSSMSGGSVPIGLGN